MTDNTENKIDVTVPPSDAEVDSYIQNLNENDRQQVRNHQLFNAAVTRKTDKSPNFATMTDQELERYKMEHGFYNR